MAASGIAPPQTGLEGGTPAPLPKTLDSTVVDWYKASPYSATAPSTNAGLIASQTPAPQVVAPNTTTDVAQIDPNQFNPNTATNATMTGATGTSTGYDASKVTVDKPQTVAGQITGLIASDSPLMQQAKTQALQDQNSRGLLNSSMAVGAGQTAVIGAALPIAQQDATTNANAATFNASSDNSAKQFTAGAKNTQTLANQQSENTAGQVNTTQSNALQSQMLQQQGTVAQANQAAKNTAVSQSAALSLQAQTSNQTAAVQQAAQVYDSAVKIAMANTSAAGQLQLAQIDSATRTNLADLQAKYNVQMQTSASMASTYQSYINQASAIMADPNLDASGKQTAITNLSTMVNNAMEVQSNVSGLQLGTLIDPKVFGVTDLAGINSGGGGGGGGGGSTPQPSPDNNTPGGTGGGGGGGE